MHLLGAVESPLDLYGDADVFALPSAHENFGMVAAEAAAAGTASVVSDRCGVAEVVRDRGALVVPYGEAPAAGSARAIARRRGAARRARTRRPRGGGRALLAERRPAAGRDLRARRVTDLAVVTQDPRFGGGARAQTEAFVRAARELGREPELLHPRFVPLVDSAAQLVESRRLAPAVRQARSAWVVAAAAPYGDAALRSGRPYAAWIGTSLDEEWAARRPHLRPSRRLALELNAPLLRRLERRVLRGATRVYATSPSARAGLAATAGLDPATVAILPIPVDTALYRPGREERRPTRRLRRPRRRSAQERAPAAPGVAGGAVAAAGHDPPPRRSRAGRAAAGGRRGNGEVASVADELRRASLFVLPSLQEGFGIVVAEALASGTPVVVTPCGGPEELVRASGGGAVLADFEPGTLAEAARGRARRRPGAWRSMRVRGRAYVEAHHSPARLRSRARKRARGARRCLTSPS